MLSEREIEILMLAAAGYNAATIGKRLRLSKRTVEVHLRTARLKLGATNTIHAVVLALKQKIIALKDV